jgi:4-amino-4-deoxy-L-arabinose transferase-like glycosyltransferase
MTLTASPEPATASPVAERSRHARALSLLGALWLLIFVASLFSPPVLDDADGTHANAARQMALSGDWVTLRVNNVRYLEKAPLPYWIDAVSFRLLGFNALATHLPQALAVLLLMLLGYRWAREVFGDRAALYTGLGVLTSAGVFLFTRVFIPDVLLSLLLAAALYCFLQTIEPSKDAGAPFMARSHRDMSGIYPYAMWTALALAVLTKGLVALVFLPGTVILYLALTGEARNWRQLKPFTGALLFLAIAAPWHILSGLRNTGGMNGHGFFWFYFINEHVLRFLGRRIPRDYNKLPGYLYWSLHLVWLFPWSLFLPLGIAGLWRKFRQQIPTIGRNSNLLPPLPILIGFMVLAGVSSVAAGLVTTIIVVLGTFAVLLVFTHRISDRLPASPFRNLTPPQCTTLLLTLFSALVLIFFSLSTNQEYYTFPAYLPLLMLLAVALARTEETSNLEPRTSNHWLTFAHAAFTILGLLIAAALSYGLWIARNLAALPNVGDLLAHRGVGDYTLSMSSLFDLTGPSFAALRAPAALALAAFAIGPAVAWFLRTRRQHLAATITIALTSTVFLIAAHIALVRFAPMLSSQDFAARIQQLESTGQISRDNTLLLYGDQAYGSSIPFYLNRPLSGPALLVDGRSSSMLFGSSFPDARDLFLTPAQLLSQWGTGPRKILFVPLERRDDAERLLGSRAVLLQQTAGKALLTDRPLDK